MAYVKRVCQRSAESRGFSPGIGFPSKEDVDRMIKNCMQKQLFANPRKPCSMWRMLRPFVYVKMTK